MAITRRPPNTIHLGGNVTVVNEYVAIEPITPGKLLEYHNDSGTLKLGLHDSADDPAAAMFAIEQIEMNLGVDDDYAAGDLVKAYIFAKGATVWALIPSGQNIAPGALLQSNGDGKLKALGSGQALGMALESSGGAVTEDTRIRVEIL